MIRGSIGRLFKDFNMMNKKILSLLVSSALIMPSAAPVFAQTPAKSQIEELQNNPKFYEIDPNSVEINYLGEVEDQPLVRGVNEPWDASKQSSVVDQYNQMAGQYNQTANEINQQIDHFNQGIQQANQVIDLLNNIINIAKKVWQIVDDSKPVSNVNSLYATALPYNMKASQLQGWSKPRSYRYSFYCKNLYGIKTVEVTYRVSFQYGGNYNGKGRYLTGVTVIPENVDTMVGYSFYMNASVPDSTVVNMGTHDNPVAALRLVLQWRISTIIKDSQSTAVYFIAGDGRYQQVADPFKSRSVSDPAVVENAVPVVSVPVQAPSVGKDSKAVALPAKSLPAGLKKDPSKVF